MDEYLPTIVVLAIVGAGVVTGILFAFSNFVMSSLHLDDNLLQQTAIVAYCNTSIESQVNAKAYSTAIIKRVVRQRFRTALKATIELIAYQPATACVTAVERIAGLCRSFGRDHLLLAKWAASRKNERTETFGKPVTEHPCT